MLTFFRAKPGYVEKLLPVGAKTLAAVAARRADFDAVCGLCIPTTRQLALLNDKAALHALAQQLKIAVPQEYVPELGDSVQHFAARVPLPCAIKPVCGEQFDLPAAQRYAIARTPRELEDAYARYAGRHALGLQHPDARAERHHRGRELLPHRLVQHRPLRPPPPLRPPMRSHQPLPSHTSPGHTLPPGSHETPSGPLFVPGGGFASRRFQ